MSLPCPTCPDPLACAHNGCENVCVTCSPTGECQRPDCCLLECVPEGGLLSKVTVEPGSEPLTQSVFAKVVEELQAPRETILQEAQRLIYGDRAAAYGPATTEAQKVAAGWSVILGCEIPPTAPALCMAWLKIVRETNRHSRDNLVDLAGYAGLAEKVIEGR